jgi:hypothetical protein
MDSSRRQMRVSRLEDVTAQRPDPRTTAAERLAMMWPLALDPWTVVKQPVRESRLPRHLVRTQRRGR